ncbi:putative SP-containing protein [Vairimorpha necatrix]|uniref:SP-containing protein n=1 Tax=Vairimorpha necatrix TaxID=6039 RepID=A0AAX4JDE5_9MICR
MNRLIFLFQSIFTTACGENEKNGERKVLDVPLLISTVETSEGFVIESHKDEYQPLKSESIKMKKSAFDKEINNSVESSKDNSRDETTITVPPENLQSKNNALFIFSEEKKFKPKSNRKGDCSCGCCTKMTCEALYSCGCCTEMTCEALCSCVSELFIQ